VIVAIGLLFAYYAHASSNQLEIITYPESELLSFSYNYADQVHIKPNFPDIQDFVKQTPKSISKQNTLPSNRIHKLNLCSCVRFLQEKGTLKIKGYGSAKNYPVNSQTPQVGSVVIFYGGRHGHAAEIVERVGNMMRLDEANYLTCKRTTDRWVDIDNGNIKGFINN
jgi:hypothetical protein